MHLEIIVEDQSGKKMIELLVPKIIGSEHTFRVIPYKGIGHIPKNLKKNVKNRMLLDQLPRLLNGYGRTFSTYDQNNSPAVIVVCDLDDKCRKKFKKELFSILQACPQKPTTCFCIAEEEGEAWLLGDINAVKKAFPKVKNIVNNYRLDSICGTWEFLADAVYPGGSKALSKKGWQSIGAEKSVWAEKISRHINVETNQSPSFQYFKRKLKEISSIAAA